MQIQVSQYHQLIKYIFSRICELLKQKEINYVQDIKIHMLITKQIRIIFRSKLFKIIFYNIYRIISMSDEDYDVIINDKEYKQLKENKNKVTLLQKKVLECKQTDDSKNLKIAQLEKQGQIQKEEIAFLVGLIENIGNLKSEGAYEQIDQLEHSGNSAQFEVLGESIMFPKKIDPKRSQLKSSHLIKKYSATIQVVRKIQEKIQSQQTLINQLNQMNAQKSELLLTKNTAKILQMISQNIQVKVNSLEQVKQIYSENKLLKDQKAKFEKENLLFKEESKKLEQLVNNYSQKLKRSQLQLAQIKKQIKDISSKGSGNNSPSSHGDRPYRIKLLIDEHIKEMQRSLGNLGGLSTQEIHSMLSSELKSLIEYIPKSMEKKK